MNARSESEAKPVTNPTNVERTSEREVVITRTINGPARIVFEAWTNADLLPGLQKHFVDIGHRPPIRWLTTDALADASHAWVQRPIRPDDLAFLHEVRYTDNQSGFEFGGL